MAKYWYSYAGLNTPAARCSAANWYFISVLYPGSQTCPANFSLPCIIFAYATPGASTHPSSPITAQISTNLCSYLGSTVGVAKRYPTGPGGKSYVYNKS